MNKLIIIAMIGISTCKAQVDSDTTFNWLVGKWEAQTKEGKFFEYWNSSNCILEARAGELVKKDTVFKEWLTLTKIKNYWWDVPVFGEQVPIAFVLKSADSKIFVFENKEHDFPQQIVYEYITKDHYRAKVQGVLHDKEIKEEYDLKRVK
ncbi:MAG: hypothetical protein IPJ60_12485 [Sphingobacteriaceae bacterium]|nr:hypothetical protein [Sphingobacteriaceae bacterium]